MESQEYYTLKEAEAYFAARGLPHIKERTLRFWRTAKKLNAVRPLGSRHILIHRSELERIEREATPGHCTACLAYA